jgi:hypothetical protein
MIEGYTLTQAEFVNLKRRLTLKQNRLRNAVLTEDRMMAARAVKAECERALAIFAEKGYPDSRHNWSRALEDAMWELRFERQ